MKIKLFTSPATCIPCRLLEQKVLKNTLFVAHPEYEKLFEVRDLHEDEAARAEAMVYGISSVPTLIFLNDKDEAVGQIVGLCTARDIVAAIERAS